MPPQGLGHSSNTAMHRTTAWERHQRPASCWRLWSSATPGRLRPRTALAAALAGVAGVLVTACSIQAAAAAAKAGSSLQSNVYSFDRMCAEVMPPPSIVLGASSDASVTLQLRRRVGRRPDRGCFVSQTVEASPGPLEKAAGDGSGSGSAGHNDNVTSSYERIAALLQPRLYIRIVHLNILRDANGHCFHTLRLYGVEAPDGMAEVCGELGNGSGDVDSDAVRRGGGAVAQYVSAGSHVDVVYDAQRSGRFEATSSPGARDDHDGLGDRLAELARTSRSRAEFLLVINEFVALDPITGRCPTLTGPRVKPGSIHLKIKISGRRRRRRRRRAAGRPARASPKERQWHKCANGRCIDSRLRCNGMNNCGDDAASDETNCRGWFG